MNLIKNKIRISLNHCKIRKIYVTLQGMVLVNPEIQPVACMDFEADVYLLFHNNYLCKGFQTVIHVGNVCQTARIIKMSKVSTELRYSM